MELKGKTVVVQTLGCKLNFAESATLLRYLEQAGCRPAKSGEPADICLVNTCSVTETADQKDRQAIHRLVRRHPGAFVVVTGCYAQLKPKEIASIPGVDLVLGANYKMDLLSRLQEAPEKLAVSDNAEASEGDAVAGAVAPSYACPTAAIDRFLPACARGGRTRYFLKVQDGCDYYCTYCTVPFARGRSRHPSIDSLVEQARQAVAQGGREIVLTGVNIGTFGKGSGETFLDLIRALDQVEGVRYRISSLEPDLLTDEMVDFMAESRHFMPHLHLPLQSGSDEVLALMHRHYRRDLFADRVDRIRRAMPDAFIGVDLIVGMRGERPECFDDSLSFLRRLPVSELHVFSYSERPGTKALTIEPVVPETEKKRRSGLVLALSDEKKADFYRRQLGRPHEVLFEHGSKNGRMYGFTENYVKVEVPWRKDWENTLQTLVPTVLNPDGESVGL